MNRKVLAILALMMIVIPISSTVSANRIIAEELNVPKFSYGSFPFEMTQRYLELVLYLNASAEVDVMIMNEYNYQIYLTGYGASTVLNLADVEKGNFVFDINQLGTYYVVVENRNSVAVPVHILISGRTLGSTALAIIGAVAGIAVPIGGFLFYNYMGNKRLKKKKELEN